MRSRRFWRTCANSKCVRKGQRNSAGRLFLYRHGNVLGCHDLPLAVAPKPCVGPDKVTLPPAFARPGFASLNNRGVPEEAHMSVVEMISWLPHYRGKSMGVAPAP
jgi:hypothetical protein